MIERPGLDRTAFFEEMEQEGFDRELIEIDRKEILASDESRFSDWEEPDWAGYLCAFFKELVPHASIEGVAFSSETAGVTHVVHVDYFCSGDNGVEMSKAISRIDLARYFVNNPVGSI